MSLVTSIAVGGLIAWVVVRARPTQSVKLALRGPALQIWPHRPGAKHHKIPLINNSDDVWADLVIQPSPFGEPVSPTEALNDLMRISPPHDGGRFLPYVNFEASFPPRILCGDVWPKGSWTALRYANALSAASPDSAFLAVGSGSILKLTWGEDEEPEVTIIPIG